MRKKILFFIDGLKGGGAEKSLLSLLSYLDYNQYDIELLVSKKGFVFDDEVPDSITFSEIEMDYPLLLRVRFKLNKKLNSSKRNRAQNFWHSFHKKIPQWPGQYDVAIAWGQGYSTYYVAEKVNAKRKYAWVNTDYSKTQFKFNFDQKFYQKYNKVVGISLFVKDVLKKYLPEEQLVQISNIIDSELIIEKSKEVIPIKYNEELFNIISAGRLVHSKAYDISIRAAKILKDKDVQFHWYIIGEGPDRDELEALIHELGLEREVSLLGFYENPYPFFNAADLYVQTSKFEGLGRTLVEAKILHLPIVSSDFGSAYGIVNHDVTGLIVPREPSEIANAILKLYNDQKLLNKMKQALGALPLDNPHEITEKFYKLIETNSV